MSEERHIPGPPSELADTLNHWRELFQRKHAEDFEALKGLTGALEAQRGRRVTRRRRKRRGVSADRWSAAGPRRGTAVDGGAAHV